jgi:hypothetical protein
MVFCKIRYYINKEHTSATLTTHFIHWNHQEPPQTKTETTHKKATTILACVHILSSLQIHTDFIWIKVGYWHWSWFGCYIACDINDTYTDGLSGGLSSLVHHPRVLSSTACLLAPFAPLVYTSNTITPARFLTLLHSLTHSLTHSLPPASHWGD